MYEFSKEFQAWSAARVFALYGIKELTCKGCQMAPFSCPGCMLEINK